MPQKPSVLASGRHVCLTLGIAHSTGLYWQAEPQVRICAAHLAEQPPRLPHQSDNGEMLKLPQANTQLLLRVPEAIQGPGLRWKGELAFDHWCGQERKQDDKDS